MADFMTGELVGWILVIALIVLVLAFLVFQLGADSPIREALTNLLETQP